MTAYSQGFLIRTLREIQLLCRIAVACWQNVHQPPLDRLRHAALVHASVHAARDGQTLCPRHTPITSTVLAQSSPSSCHVLKSFGPCRPSGPRLRQDLEPAVSSGPRTGQGVLRHQYSDTTFGLMRLQSAIQTSQYLSPASARPLSESYGIICDPSESQPSV